MPKDAPVNIGAPLGEPTGAHQRVSGMQAKLHRWAAADGGRRFDDLFNLVCDPATLLVAFGRVAGNTGANTPAWTAWRPPGSSGASACPASWAGCASR